MSFVPQKVTRFLKGSFEDCITCFGLLRGSLPGLGVRALTWGGSLQPDLDSSARRHPAFPVPFACVLEGLEALGGHSARDGCCEEARTTQTRSLR